MMRKRPLLRVGIREQLAAFGLLLVLIGLAIVSIPTWLFVHSLVTNVKKQDLAQSAAIKAAQITSQLDLIESTCATIASRYNIQRALIGVFNDTSSGAAERMDTAAQTLQTALVSSGSVHLLQGRIFSPTENNGSNVLLSETAPEIERIPLPLFNENGSRVYLGDDNGFPKDLYPSLSYLSRPTIDKNGLDANSTVVTAFPNISITEQQFLLLGPLMINDTFSLISFTRPIMSIEEEGSIIGYLTVIASTLSLMKIQLSPEGLGSTGETLLLGPNTPWNRFNRRGDVSDRNSSGNASSLASAEIKFILKPQMPDGEWSSRHDVKNFASPFPLKQFPIALEAYREPIERTSNASGTLSTENEQGDRVAAGFARPQTSLVDWVLIVEQTQKEAFSPIDTLRKILVTCVFGTVGLVLIFIFPCAHYSVRPIRRLKEATENSIAPPGYDEMDIDGDGGPANSPRSPSSEKQSKLTIKRLVTGPVKRLSRPKLRTRHSNQTNTRRHHVFRIPGKVGDKKHLVRDELTELTTTFNEMSDELLMQYTNLEDKVAERTKELEISKKAAEAANESKTLFMANISHELKTPLNGILGMCAYCMEETDIHRVKNSLKTVYESGNLLLRLLEDLLHFSRNQVGHQLALEEEEFHIGDISTQITALFLKSAKERRIDFGVSYVEGIPTTGLEAIDERPHALGRANPVMLKDLRVVGDRHRILQVILNLVSNSLKFTPKGGAVNVRIKCLGPTKKAKLKGLKRRGSSLRLNARPTPGLAKSGTSSPNKSGEDQSVTLIQETISETPTRLSNTRVSRTDSQATRESDRPGTPSSGTADADSAWYLFEFAVEDTGNGIPEDLQQKVFEPFVQVDPGLSKKFGGAGLGLTICKQLATLMDGSISLQSSQGVGTSVLVHVPLRAVYGSSGVSPRTFSLDPLDILPTQLLGSEPRGSSSGTDALTDIDDNQPLHNGFDCTHSSSMSRPGTPNGGQRADNVDDNDDEASTSSTGHEGRILIADDNSVNVEVLRRLLKLERLSDVLVARDGQEAVDLVRSNFEENRQFSLIFMDIQMPRLDGLQSTRLIRDMGYSAPIVALTAASEDSIVEKGIDSGIDYFLSKPIRRPALKKVLSQYSVTAVSPEISPREGCDL